MASEYGPVFSGRAAEDRIRRLATFASCGDRVTALALQLDHPPLVGIVDFKTQRKEKISPNAFVTLKARRYRRVRNPPGMLTESLRRAVRELVGIGGGLIEVEGEEDLGSLALVEALPLGATVIYGIPGAGVSFVTVDVVAKEHVRALIARMELRRIARGS
ncbi:MAG: GTP-dependent dephospho-CoA kinase family protein [Thermoplasmata archaeon]|nr:GTP-dependent dephospho-CoA kinase family protein [Thermoplasmata archaeon]